MRLWSIHPCYLDSKGLVALWREALLAQKVLYAKTRGYKNHPQLIRFKRHPHPKAAIGFYLREVYDESCRRGYCFNKAKIPKKKEKVKPIKVTRGQILFEYKHLKDKIKKRSSCRLDNLCKNKEILTHPLFKVTKGKRTEGWERRR